MSRYCTAAGWATMMILVALLARFSWADRDAVATMLLVMPLFAFLSMQRSRRCPTAVREG